MSELSSATRALLESAKAEAPSMAARAKIWSSVSSAAGLAGAGAAGASAAVASGAATKLLLLGGLLGSTLTIGVAATALYLRPPPPPRPAPPAMVQAPAPKIDGPASTTADGIPALSPAAPAATPVLAMPAASVSSTATPTVATAALAPRPVAPSPEDALMREASLVAEARAALVRGDAAAALRAVRAARRLPSHQLEPEELSLEAQALRALGRGDDATAVDGTLKGKYPDHALAR